mgnify:FL=1
MCNPIIVDPLTSEDVEIFDTNSKVDFIEDQLSESGDISFANVQSKLAKPVGCC